MTVSTDLSKILASLLRNPRRGLEESSALLRTLDSVWYASPSRQKGCFFRLTDDAFDVPELHAFRQFAQELRKPPLQMTNGFAILDYSLPRFPKDYTNAIYLLLDETRVSEIELYARRLTGLYHYKDIGDRIFDSNKVILSQPHYENFILSRAASKSDRTEDEYFIDLLEMEQQLRALLNGEMEILFRTDGVKYLEALATVYEKIRSEPCRSIIPEILKKHCSPLVCSVVLGEPEEREVGGQMYADIQSAFVTYLVFFLSIMPSSPEEFVYFPVQMVAGSEQTLRWVGGVLLPLVKTSNREQRVALKSAVQVIVSSFYSAYTDALLLQSLEKAAQAQIMSRNMSHNIGSHALARIKGSDMRDVPEDSERLLGYLQERMDFVARVATEWPAWREPVLFYADLIHGFFKQGLLLNNLVADDGYVAEKQQIEFRVQLPHQQNPMVFTYEKGDTNGEDNRYSEFRRQEQIASRGDFTDLLVAVPGGPVGRQAFYGFLENAIRNAAKHNPGRQPLQVVLGLEECGAMEGRESAFYRFRYQDSISMAESRSDLVKRVRSHLLEDLVDTKSRQPIDHAWGIQEMKVYARYLAHPFENERDALTEQQEGHLLWATEEPFAQEGKTRDSAKTGASNDQSNYISDGPKVLSYSLALQRPCLVLIVGSHPLPGDEETRRRYGLQTIEDGKLDPKLLHERAPALLYIVQNENDDADNKLLEWLSDNKLTIPARVMIRPTGSDAAAKLSNQLRQLGLFQRVRIDADPRPLACGDESPLSESDERSVQCCLLDLYQRWLGALTAERNFEPPFNVIIYFDREKSPYPERWASLGKSVVSFGFDHLLNVFPVSKQKANPSDKGSKTIFLEPWKAVTRLWDETEGRFLDSLQVGNADKGTWMIFDNHKRGTPDKVLHEFYQYLGAHSENISPHPNNREAFDRMTNVPEGFAGVLSLIKLVEACLLRILVLDERVAALALELERVDEVKPRWKLTWAKSKEGTEYGDKVTSNFGEAGICFAPFIDVVRDKELQHICLLHSEGTVRWLNHKEEDLFPSISLHGSEVVSCAALGLKGNPSPERIPLSTDSGEPFFDVVIVHKGLLEWLSECVADHFNQELFLKSLHRLGARVVLTSGRGAQIEGSTAQFPFVEFAVLESCLVRELSKASLANVLMAVTGRESQQ
jgi:hypothetical protein